jgi:hypothetical protein
VAACSTAQDFLITSSYHAGCNDHNEGRRLKVKLCPHSSHICFACRATVAYPSVKATAGPCSFSIVSTYEETDTSPLSRSRPQNGLTSLQASNRRGGCARATSMPLLPDEVLIVRRSSRMVNSQPQSQRSSNIPVMHWCIVLVPVRVKINQSLHLINGPIRGVKISGQSHETSQLPSVGGNAG